MSNAQTEAFEESVRDAEVVTSPLPVEEEKPETMTFYAALAEALVGKRIQRKFWDKSEYGHFEGDFLHIFKGGADHTWLISKGDVIEEDWIVF
jgi:hypothetical protein